LAIGLFGFVAIMVQPYRLPHLVHEFWRHAR
jgi:hypothetical protein